MWGIWGGCKIGLYNRMMERKWKLLSSTIYWGWQGIREYSPYIFPNPHPGAPTQCCPSTPGCSMSSHCPRPPILELRENQRVSYQITSLQFMPSPFIRVHGELCNTFNNVFSSHPEGFLTLVFGFRLGSMDVQDLLATGQSYIQLVI